MVKILKVSNKAFLVKLKIQTETVTLKAVFFILDLVIVDATEKIKK